MSNVRHRPQMRPEPDFQVGDNVEMSVKDDRGKTGFRTFIIKDSKHEDLKWQYQLQTVDGGRVFQEGKYFEESALVFSDDVFNEGKPRYTEDSIKKDLQQTEPIQPALSSGADSSRVPQDSGYGTQSSAHQVSRAAPSGERVWSSSQLDRDQVSDRSEEQEVSFPLDDFTDDASVATDGKRHGVPMEAEGQLIDLFVKDMTGRFSYGITALSFSKDYAKGLCSELIRQFAMLLEVGIVNDEDPVHHESVTFVRDQRWGIVNRLAEFLEDWKSDPTGAHSFEDNVLSSLSPTMQNQFKGFTFVDEMMLEQQFAHRTDLDSPGWNAVGVIPWSEQFCDPKPTSKPPALRDTPGAQEFLLNRPEYLWLLEQLTRLANWSQTGHTYTSVRGKIVDAIARSHGNLKLVIDWDASATLQAEFPQGSLRSGLLTDMIAYNGEACQCYAATTTQHILQLWPEYGKLALQCLETALTSAHGGVVLQIDGLRMHVELVGETTHVELQATNDPGSFRPNKAMLEIAETCIWIATACRTNGVPDVVGFRLPKIDFPETPIASRATLMVYVEDLSNAQYSSSINGECWRAMVRNPVIALGYPVPKREERMQGSGLEVSLDLMVALSRADWATTFGGTLLLMGITSALVAKRAVGKSIVWHLLVNKDGKIMTYEKACKEQSGTLHLSDLKQLDLHRCRHFVGLWTTAACVNAGCRDESMYRFGMGNGEKFSEHTVTWQTLTIGGGQYGTAALGFAIGRKDITPSFVGDGGHPYDMVVQEAANNMTVLFYSSDDRRAWLLDGSSALLHLARAHLNDDISKYKHTDVLNHLQHMENGGRVKYAADILRANATLKIYLKLESMPEDKIACNEGLARSTIGFRYASTARQKPSSGSSGQQRTAVAWTYQQLVMRLWQRLRQMNECLRKLKQQPPDLSFRFSGPRIIGWEAHDLISFKDSLPPLFARTGRDSKQWLQYSGALGSVVLMARTFGDLVVPESSKMPLCPRMRFVEKGRDLLAVPCNVLEGPARRYLRDRAPEPLTCVQIEKDIFLHAYDPTSGVCCCDDGTLCNPISKLSSRGKPRLHKNEKLTNGDFFLRYPKGAVVIGSSGASKTAQWRSKTLQRMRVSKNIVNPLQEASTISSTSPEIQRIDTGSLEGSGGNSHQKPSGGADMSPTRTRITSFLAPDTRVANAGSPTSFDNFPDDESPRIGDPVALDDRHSGRPNHGQRQAHAGTDVDHDRPRPSTDNGEDGSDDSFFSASDSCQS